MDWAGNGFGQVAGFLFPALHCFVYLGGLVQAFDTAAKEPKRDKQEKEGQQIEATG